MHLRGIILEWTYTLLVLSVLSVAATRNNVKTSSPIVSKDGVHIRKERQTLLQAFVLGDFTPLDDSDEKVKKSHNKQSNAAPKEYVKEPHSKIFNTEEAKTSHDKILYYTEPYVKKSHKKVSDIENVEKPHSKLWLHTEPNKRTKKSNRKLWNSENEENQENKLEHNKRDTDVKTSHKKVSETKDVEKRHSKLWLHAKPYKNTKKSNRKLWKREHVRNQENKLNEKTKYMQKSSNTFRNTDENEDNIKMSYKFLYPNDIEEPHFYIAQDKDVKKHQNKSSYAEHFDENVKTARKNISYFDPVSKPVVEGNDIPRQVTEPEDTNYDYKKQTRRMHRSDESGGSVDSNLKKNLAQLSAKKSDEGTFKATEKNFIRSAPSELVHSKSSSKNQLDWNANYYATNDDALDWYNNQRYLLDENRYYNLPEVNEGIRSDGYNAPPSIYTTEFGKADDLDYDNGYYDDDGIESTSTNGQEMDDYFASKSFPNAGKYGETGDFNQVPVMHKKNSESQKRKSGFLVNHNKNGRSNPSPVDYPAIYSRKGDLGSIGYQVLLKHDEDGESQGESQKRKSGILVNNKNGHSKSDPVDYAAVSLRKGDLGSIGYQVPFNHEKNSESQKRKSGILVNKKNGHFKPKLDYAAAISPRKSDNGSIRSTSNDVEQSGTTLRDDFPTSISSRAYMNSDYLNLSSKQLPGKEKLVTGDNNNFNKSIITAELFENKHISNAKNTSRDVDNSSTSKNLMQIKHHVHDHHLSLHNDKDSSQNRTLEDSEASLKAVNITEPFDNKVTKLFKNKQTRSSKSTKSRTSPTSLSNQTITNTSYSKTNPEKRKHIESLKSEPVITTVERHGLKNKLIIEQNLPTTAGYDLYILKVPPVNKDATARKTTRKNNSEELEIERKHRIIRNETSQIGLLKRKTEKELSLFQKLLNTPVKMIFDIFEQYQKGKIDLKRTKLKDLLVRNLTELSSKTIQRNHHPNTTIVRYIHNNSSELFKKYFTSNSATNSSLTTLNNRTKTFNNRTYYKTNTLVNTSPRSRNKTNVFRTLVNEHKNASKSLPRKYPLLQTKKSGVRNESKSYDTTEKSKIKLSLKHKTEDSADVRGKNEEDNNIDETIKVLLNPDAIEEDQTIKNFKKSYMPRNNDDEYLTSETDMTRYQVHNKTYFIPLSGKIRGALFKTKTKRKASEPGFPAEDENFPESRHTRDSTTPGYTYWGTPASNVQQRQIITAALPQGQFWSTTSTQPQSANAQYTFRIHQGTQNPATTQQQQVSNFYQQPATSTRESYKGIFGNDGADLEQACINFGKQDFVSVCPSGWIAYKQFCFMLMPGANRWSDISGMCSSYGGKVAMPKSQDVLAFLVNELVARKQYSTPYFVGLRKRDEDWEWIDDTPLSQGLRNDGDSDFDSCAVLLEGSLRKMPCELNSGYICELKMGVKASRMLATGDSLTKGYFHGGKEYHPYGQKLEELLNTDDHACFVVETSAKNGEKTTEMKQRMTDYLNAAQRTFDWVIILAGTNDLLLTSDSADMIADQIMIMHEVAHARGAQSIAVTIPEIFCERTHCRNVHERRQLVNKRLRIYAEAEGDKVFLSDVALALSLHRLPLSERKAFWEPSGVHMKPFGYDRMAEVIFRDLMEAIEASTND